ncbi:MAG: hypothetical protein E6J04_02045 [Chloroflexi bacterium]|nr:MAG: hypothetical protein E6J04_02045 [Chloroflexota bacterium]
MGCSEWRAPLYLWRSYRFRLFCRVVADIASGGDDKTVQIWSSVDGTPIFTYTGHKDGVRSVNWSPNGKLVASGSFDETVQVWRVP